MRVVKFNEKLIQYLQKSLVDFEIGKISSQTFGGRLMCTNQISRIIEQNYKHRMEEFKTKNQINIDIEFALPLDYEEDLIKCPDKNDQHITRGECLDYSGDHPSCSNCKNYKTTRELLVK